MKKMPGYTDLWLSPVTGLRHADVEILFPDLHKGYIWEGGNNDRPYESPTLIDIKLDLMKLRKRELYLPYNQIWIGNFQNRPVPQQQINVFNLPTLGAALFPYPSSIPLPAIPMPNPTFNPFSGLDWLMSGPWLPQIFAGSPNTLNTQSETVISSSLAMTQIKVAQAIKRLDVTGFVLQSRTINFLWDNPLAALIPAPIQALYGLSPSYTFTNAQALDELGEGILWVDDQGVLSLASLPQNNIWIGDANKKPSAQLTIQVLNLPDLTYKKIWRGDATNRPVESDDLTNLEETVEEIEGDVTNLEEQITEIQEEIDILQEEVAELQNWQAAAEAQLEEILTEIANLQADLAVLESELATLQATVESLLDWQIAAEAQFDEILAELGTLQAEVGSLQSEIAFLEGEFATLQAEIAALSEAMAAIGGMSAAAGFFSFLSGLFGGGGGGGGGSYSADITLIGDVLGAGTVNQPILTVFTPNPVFTGNASMTIPVGTTAQRPLMPIVGMERFNTTI